MYFINLFNKSIKTTSSTKSGSSAVKIELWIKNKQIFRVNVIKGDCEAQPPVGLQ